MRVDTLARGAVRTAEECIVNTAEVLLENLLFVEAYARSVGALAVELLKPLDKAVTVEHPLDGIVLVHLFLDFCVAVVFERVRFPVKDGVTFLLVDFAHEKQIDETLAHAVQNRKRLGFCRGCVRAAILRVSGIGVHAELHFGLVVV